ncbi:MAG: alpha/beta fold hydrolase [Pirellulales bacterium]|nr:alpha/beta fold hydrolase [Pirellulales bacterium]
MRPLNDISRKEVLAETTYALAEVAFVAAESTKTSDPRAALEYYCLAASESYRFLFDPRLDQQRNPYDPLYRGASDLYNGSLDAVLRILKSERGLNLQELATASSDQQPWDVSVISRGGPWQADAYERLELAADYEVGGLTNEYRTYGLGVPLVAVRRENMANAAADQYYPPGLAVPLTAFVRPLTWDHWHPDEVGASRSVVLELYNPLQATSVIVGPHRIPLESDLTTPLAYFLNEAELEPLATKGLLRPSHDKHKLFFAQPFDPDKIPVVFVHGLWSDPTSWAEMLNELRATPAVRARYQFWFYMYPTGQPFWYSAAELRQKLADVRTNLDPQRRFAAMDQMVLVGHSMGGLVSKMQAVESGNEFWQAISERPFSEIDTEDAVRDRLAKTFFFRPNPSVHRVITIGSPHRGSSYANATTKWLASKFVRLPGDLVDNVQKLVGMNPGIFRSGFSPEYDTSIDSLSADSPILPVLLNARRQQGIHVHNVIGRKSPTTDGDGIVSLESASLPNADSEIVVEASHVEIHRNPLTILEVRRILLDHLQEMDRWTRHPIPAYDNAIRPALIDRRMRKTREIRRLPR